MMIKIETAIYIGLTLGFLIWFLAELFTAHPGGNFTPGKKSGEMGCMSTIVIIIWIILSLIWGGFYWW